MRHRSSDYADEADPLREILAGPMYGQRGGLAVDGEQVQCHACGRYFTKLSIHVLRTHGLRPAEYRAIFGLNRTQPLVSPAYQTLLREAQQTHLAAIRPARSRFKAMTREERAAYAGQARALQARLAQGRARAGTRLPAARRRQMRETARALWARPAYRAKVTAALKAKWREPVYRAKQARKAESRDYRLLLSAKAKARWRDPAYRARALAAQRRGPLALATRAKLRAVMRGKWQDRTYRERVLRARGQGDARNAPRTGAAEPHGETAATSNVSRQLNRKRK